MKYIITYTTTHEYVCDATDEDDATCQFLDSGIEYSDIVSHAQLAEVQP
jgi:hypothetical protein